MSPAALLTFAISWTIRILSIPGRVTIHTDSTTSFAIFNSLLTLELYNPMLLAAVKICIESGIYLCVFHIECKKNTMADNPSHRALGLAQSLAPGIKILQ